MNSINNSNIGRLSKKLSFRKSIIHCCLEPEAVNIFKSSLQVILVSVNVLITWRFMHLVEVLSFFSSGDTGVRLLLMEDFHTWGMCESNKLCEKFQLIHSWECWICEGVRGMWILRNLSKFIPQLSLSLGPVLCFAKELSQK